MPRRKKKQMPKGTQRGRQLTPVQKEQIRQTFMITGNKRETARLCAVSEKSVYNVLNEPEDPMVQRQREQAASSLATKVHVKASEILDHITAEDFDSGYLTEADGTLVFDKQGRPIFMGPTLNQKAISAAIMVDKLAVLEDYRRKLGGEPGMGELPAPESIKALVSGIQSKIKKLRVLDVEFEDSPQAKAAEDLLHQAQREIEAEDAEFEPLDFDNPGS